MQDGLTEEGVDIEMVGGVDEYKRQRGWTTVEVCMSVTADGKGRGCNS